MDEWKGKSYAAASGGTEALHQFLRRFEAREYVNFDTREDAGSYIHSLLQGVGIECGALDEMFQDVKSHNVTSNDLMEDLGEVRASSLLFVLSYIGVVEPKGRFDCIKNVFNKEIYAEYPGPVTLVDTNRPSKLMGSAHTVMGLRCRIKRKNSEVWHIESILDRDHRKFTRNLARTGKRPGLNNEKMQLYGGRGGFLDFKPLT